MYLSAKKKTILWVALAVIFLTLLSISVKKIYNTVHDPVWNYDMASMPAGSKIVRFEKCGENKFCGYSDFKNEIRVVVHYKNDKITSIIKVPPPLVKHRVEWFMELTPSQQVISKTLVADGQKLILPHVLCQYNTDGSLERASFLNNSLENTPAISAEQRCGQENPNQNPELIKILRFFNSNEAKRMLQ